MKPESLRIGNYYNSAKFNQIVKCEMADFSEIYQRAEGATPDESDIAAIFEPIPLTEEWLIKFGLPKREVITNPENYNEYSIREDFDIYCHMDRSGNCLLWGECDEGEDFFIIKYDTVHEFQNIFRDLTAKEVTK